LPKGTKRKESLSESAPIPSKKIRNLPLTKIADFPKVYQPAIRVNVRVKISSDGMKKNKRCQWMIDDVEGHARTVMMSWLNMKKIQLFIDFFQV
jgi:hypothetical protein